MTVFPEPPRIEYHSQRGGSRIYVLTEDYYYRGGIIPQGFLTDGVSVCQILWPWFHPLGMLFPAAVGHDFRYYSQAGTRRQADLEMLSDMRELGVGRIKRQLAYRVLRAFGWKAWVENQNRSVADFYAMEYLSKTKIKK